jgi:hypothetical protein
MRLDRWCVCAAGLPLALLFLSVSARPGSAEVRGYLADRAYGGYAYRYVPKPRCRSVRSCRRPCLPPRVEYKIPVAEYPAVTKPRLPGKHKMLTPRHIRYQPKPSTKGLVKMTSGPDRRFKFRIDGTRYKLPTPQRVRTRFPYASRRFRIPLYDCPTLCRDR